MSVKRFSMEDFRAAGFDRAGIQRKAKVVTPRDYRDIFRIAHWLQVPAEYLVGLAPEYENKPAWEVASRASLDFFFKRHPEGREAIRYRDDFEQLIAARPDEAPATIAAWSVLFEGFQLGRARERSDAQKLERSVSGDPNTSRS